MVVRHMEPPWHMAVVAPLHAVVDALRKILKRTRTFCTWYCVVGGRPVRKEPMRRGGYRSPAAASGVRASARGIIIIISNSSTCVYSMY
jgi:hypothetical protein